MAIDTAKHAGLEALAAEAMGHAHEQLQQLQRMRKAHATLEMAMRMHDLESLEAEIEAAGGALKAAAQGAINGSWLKEAVERAQEVLKELHKDAREQERTYQQALKQPLALSAQQLRSDLEQLRSVVDQCESKELERAKIQQLQARFAAREAVASALSSLETLPDSASLEAHEEAVARLLDALQAPGVPPEQPSAVALKKRYEQRIDAMRKRLAREEVMRMRAHDKVAAPLLKRIGSELRKDEASLSVSKLRRAIEDARSKGIEEDTIPFAEEKLRRVEAERAGTSAKLVVALGRRGEADTAERDAELLQQAELALHHAKEVGSEIYGSSKGSVAAWRQHNKSLQARELEAIKTQRVRESREQQVERRRIRGGS